MEAPTKEELAQLAATIERRVLRLLRLSGLCPDDADDLSLGADDGPLLGWQAASARGRIALGPRAGWRVLRIGEQEVAVPKKGLVADAGGFNLHAGVHVPAGQRERLLSLCRYILRPPLAMERLRRLPDGRIQIDLKRPYSSGTRAFVFEPMDFLAKLAALVPPPRLHQVRYHGIFAPHCSQRAAVVPAVPGPEQESVSEPSKTEPASRRARRAPRLTWAQLLERTFAIDVLACACGGRLRFLCWIFNPEALRAIERSLGRAPPNPPPPSPIRSPQEAFPWAHDEAA